MRSWHENWKASDPRPPWEWAAENLRIKNSVFGDRFKPDLTPWLKEPLEEISKNANEEITIQCCVQSGKTTLIEVAAAWALRFQPAPMMVNCQTDDDAKDLARDRLYPALESIPEIMAKLPRDGSRRSQTNISFTGTGFCLIQGANIRNLQSKSIRWVFNDEVWLWDDGLLDEARKRATQWWNRRRVNASTAGEVGGDLDRAFEAGDKREWNLRCPACEKLNLPSWKRIRWPSNEETRPGGVWNFAKVKELARFVCEHCNAEHVHTLENHRYMNDHGAFVATNPNPTPRWLSFRWNALCLSPVILSWGDLAVEWLKADIEFDKGNETARREFKMKRLAESWDTQGGGMEIKPVAPDRVHQGDLEGEAFRLLTVDVQQNGFWFIIQAWNRAGDDLIMDAGKLETWEDVAAKQAQWNVQDRCVFVDSGDGNMTTKIYEQCVQHGSYIKGAWICWTALKGAAEESFRWRNGTQTYLLPYSWPPSRADAMLGAKSEGGRSCPLIRWSNSTIKDIARRRRDGLATGVRSLVAPGVTSEFNAQMFSEHRKFERDRNGREVSRWVQIGRRANHLWDCYCMGIVGACIAKVIGERNTSGDRTSSNDKLQLVRVTRDGEA